MKTKIDSLQVEIPSTISDTIFNRDENLPELDSINSEAFRIDTSQADSIAKVRKGSDSGIDTVVYYSAKDSAIFDVKSKKLRLRGSADLKYKEQELKADVIEMYFEETLLKSHGVRDSSGVLRNFPEFYDKGEMYVGERITYNFETGQGTISLGETEVSEGFYFGAKIKRVSSTEMFVQNGRYTDCPKPEPNYYFGSPEMKIISGDRVFIDPLIFFVEDMPIFALPFGLFFPSQGGRRSGVIIPSFFFSKNRGVVFEDMGLYLALSDYYDTQFTGDIYSKGGYMIKNNSRWVLRDKFKGDMQLEYGRTRANPDDAWTKNYKIAAKHDHNIDPYQRINLNVNFVSSDFNRQTSTNLRSRQQQNIYSNASYYKNFDNGSSFSLSYQRNENIINGEYSQTLPEARFSLPSWKPFKSMVSSKSWIGDISLSYSGSTFYKQNKDMNLEYLDGGAIDTNYRISEQSKISHSPRLSISPKLGHFSITPSISFNADNYFRKERKYYDVQDSSVRGELQNGFFWEYWYSVGMSAQTRVFGIADKDDLFLFNWLYKATGITKTRHTVQPTVSWSYTPDLSDPKLGFYDEYYDPVREEYVTYSLFERDGGGRAPRRESQSLSYSLLQNFESKVAQGDTLEDKNLEWFRWTLNGNVNLTADSLKWSDVSMNFRVPALKGVQFSASSNFTLYDQAPTLDANGDRTGSYRKVNTFLIESGKGLMRPTNLNLQLSTSFNSRGMGFQSEEGSDETTDSAGLGSRFQQRMSAKKKQRDFFGEMNSGWSRFSPPWRANLGINFQYSEPYVKQITRRLNLNATFGFNLTETWSFDGSLQYDLINRELISPILNVRKDFQCWELSMQWYPVGYNQGFYARFGIKSQTLKDLQLERRSNALYR